jgi:hypothetical protein
MTYVPVVVPPTNSPPPSPRTRELAGLLTKVLDEYTKAHPAVTKAEIRTAFRMAQMTTGRDSKRIVLALVFGVMVLVFSVGLFFARAGGGEVVTDDSAPMLIMAVIILLGVLAAAIAVKSRS